MSTSGSVSRRNRLNLTLPGSATQISDPPSRSNKATPNNPSTDVPVSGITDCKIVNSSYGNVNATHNNAREAKTFSPAAEKLFLSPHGSPKRKLIYSDGIFGNQSERSSNNNNRPTNRISTAPVDVTEVLRQLEIQDLDDTQRRRLSAFLADKQKIGELRLEDFEKLSELGTGNGGVVTCVRHTATGLIMAKKNIHLEVKPTVKTQIIRELQVLHDCNSPYIVGYYGAFFADGDISLCMEYMDGGSLDIVLKYAGRIPEPIVAKILYSVLKGLVYLRDALHIIHRDVKPSNILVSRTGDIKLCDFGVSGQLIDSLANSFVGTRSYMAPERLTGEQYNTLSDVWSLGLSLVELATGRYPIPAIEDENVYLSAFKADREVNLHEHMETAKHGKPLPAVTGQTDGPMAIFELLFRIVDQPPPKLPRFCFSDDFIDVVDACLRRPPKDRPSLECLLQHVFVKTAAGACPSGQVHRQSAVLDSKTDTHDTFDDPINIGRYLVAVLPPVNVDEYIL